MYFMMRKNFLILVIAVVLLSFFNTTDTNFIAWDKPSVNTEYINSPDNESLICLGTETSVFGLIVNYFMQLAPNNYDIVVDINANISLEDEVELEVITSKEGDQEIVLKNVQFDNNSYELSDVSIKELDRFVNYLHHNSSLKIAIEGHTDNIGSSLNNRLLSEKRARSVYDYLLQNGITKNQLVAYAGYGEDNPIKDNNTVEGRAVNRRTSFKLITDNDIEDQLRTQFQERERKQLQIEQEPKKPVVKKQEPKKPVVKKVIKPKVRKPVVKESLPSDEEIIQQSSNIKKNAKKLILESLKEGKITMNDVNDLLMEFPKKTIKKKHVKELIKRKKK